MVDWEENTLTFESKQLHYYFSRSGTGRTIIFLHGIMDNGMCYDRVAEQFAENYDLYLPDARGHGQSSEMPDKGDFSLLIEDIKDISEQNNLSNIIVMGHSMGGAEAAQFAAQEPQFVKAVILEDPAFFSGFSKKLLHAL
ncbi:MAG TPA: alpha/beta hydrolase, partial [Candidatus Lokiarchaeia archaeon]|nr:alpha/beta hydrolase [Candidatus Lokiarchaeia archaeon]